MFTVVIPTYRRTDELSRALFSILSQTRMPAEVLIIDDHETPQEFLGGFSCKFAAKGVEFTYYKKDHATERRGLSESKNRALELAKHDVIFIDDDIELSKTFIERIEEAWRAFDGEKIIGVGGKIVNNRQQGRLERMFNRLFGLSSKTSWDVTPVGFQVWDESVERPEIAFYVHGGLCALKRDIARELGGFTVFSGGRTGLEDVDFCLRAKQAGYFFVYQPEAQALHHFSPEAREGSFSSGVKETVNRKDIFRRLSPKTIFHRVWFLRSLKGWILRQILAGHVAKAAGMLIGFFRTG